MKDWPLAREFSRYLCFLFFFLMLFLEGFEMQNCRMSFLGHFCRKTSQKQLLGKKINISTVSLAKNVHRRNWLVGFGLQVRRDMIDAVQCDTHIHTLPLLNHVIKIFMVLHQLSTYLKIRRQCPTDLEKNKH